ncbi:hypothetical protein FRC17_007686 [Serendipita sp. 399]|nr:hypothetical protein FRC17_007686 [Serendipita sp. 399]
MAPSPLALRQLYRTSSHPLKRPFSNVSSLQNIRSFSPLVLKAGCRFFNSTTPKSTQVPPTPPAPSPPSPPNPNEKGKQRSRHASWYSDTLPNMIPIAILSFVVYELLELTRLEFVREHQTVEHLAKVEQLTNEIKALQQQITSTSESQQVAIQESPTAKSWWRIF